MNNYRIELRARHEFIGYENVIVEVEANDEEEAFDKARMEAEFAEDPREAEMDYSEILDENILSVEPVKEKPYRCDKTLEMFVE